MNVAFFLIPKREVAYLFDYFTMRQAIEKMEYHHYTAIPILNQNGEYVGTLTEGDLLRKLKNTPGLDYDRTQDIPLRDVPRLRDVKPIGVHANIDDIFTMAVDQNFIPVIDDTNKFIGIIRRREIIEYMFRRMNTAP
jgi:CBS domain-containing protein